jgi:hypothetical protein
MLRRLFPDATESEDPYDTGPLRWPSPGNRPFRRHPATRRTRWLWLVPLVGGFLAVLGIVASHDPGPGLSLSGRGWFTIGLAGLLVVLLAIHRNTGQLMRALAEYTVVVLLAVLLVTATGMQQAPTPAAKHPASRAGAATKTAGDACPSIVQMRDWLACLWHTSQETNRRNHPPTTTTPKRHR